MEGSVLKRKVNIFLIFIPLVIFRGPVSEFLRELLGLSSEMVEGSIEYVVFALAALSLIPLAGFVESAVEELAELLGPFVGGLLHTTFGNVAELLIGIFILTSGVPHAAEIVLASVAGVIVRNSLLGLGISTLFGAWRNGSMKFNTENASEYSTVFALAVVGLSLPTIVHRIPLSGGTLGEELDLPFGIPLSAFLAVVLLVSYLAYIGFAVFRLGEGYDLPLVRQARREARRQRRMQRHGGLPTLPDTQALFREERETAERELLGTQGGAAAAVAVAGLPGGEAPKAVYAKAGLLEHKRKLREERGERGLFHQHRVLRGLAAVVVLGIATAGVASMSENFAESVEGILTANANLETFEFFLGLIVIPVLAGMVEIYGSISAARENRMEITMAVTAGATIQMILLVVPILVFVGLAVGNPLNLVFQPLDIIIFGAATFVFMLLSRDGESTWLEGVQLVTLWSLIAVVALVLPPGA
ncbi:MAG TPA: hypothetical protein VFU88_20065 [Ktedonobacterales bacterium]|nr:hypothetical protein [Ktedonobacterales bacterium]